MEKRLHRSGAETIVVVLLLLFAVFMIWFLSVWGSWGRGATGDESALEKPMPEQAQIVYDEEHGGEEIRIWDEAYEAKPYVEVMNSAVRDTLPAMSYSPRISCRETERGILYYANIEGCPGWIVGFYDDELCAATNQNIEAIYKSVNVTEIPAWIEEARAAVVNVGSTGSDSGLEAG